MIKIFLLRIIYLQLRRGPWRVRQVAHLGAVSAQAPMYTAALVTDQHASVHRGPARFWARTENNQVTIMIDKLEYNLGVRAVHWFYFDQAEEVNLSFSFYHHSNQLSASLSTTSWTQRVSCYRCCKMTTTGRCLLGNNYDILLFRPGKKHHLIVLTHKYC